MRKCLAVMYKDTVYNFKQTTRQYPPPRGLDTRKVVRRNTSGTCEHMFRLSRV
jgi:hypothetical protein